MDRARHWERGWASVTFTTNIGSYRFQPIKCVNLVVPSPCETLPYIIYTLLDGLSYNTRGYFASCVVFFRAPQGRGKMRAMSKMSASIIC